MDWIKRNLYFLIGAVVALALMGVAGWFLYSKWELNNSVWSQLEGDYGTLTTLNEQNPHPGFGKIDNIALAKQQRQQLLGVIDQVRAKFRPIPPIPNIDPVTDSDFSAALSRTVSELQNRATNANVIVPNNYHFSFEAQYSRVIFASNSLATLAYQLGDVKALADILIGAQINYLDGIRRQRVSADDNSGPQTDYTDRKGETNDLAILTPYEVSFRCFSSELASVLAAFGSSPYGLIVKAINVEPAPLSVEEQLQQALPTAAYLTQPGGNPYSRYGLGGGGNPYSRYGLGGAGGNPYSRYGLGAGGNPYSRYGGGSPYGANAQPATPLRLVTPHHAASHTAASHTVLKTVLDEKQLKVTLAVSVLRLQATQSNQPGRSRSSRRLSFSLPSQ
jgi:hypothetical protein